MKIHSFLCEELVVLVSTSVIVVSNISIVESFVAEINFLVPRKPLNDKSQSFNFAEAAEATRKLIFSLLLYATPLILQISLSNSLPLPEDRFIKLSLEHISFIVIFLLAIQKDYPKAKFAIKKADLVIDLILDQLSEDDKKLIMENDND